MTLTESRVRTLLEPYHVAAPAPVCSKILIYMDLLSKWRKKISLTTITDDEEVVRFHFGESIFALSLRRFENGRLADVGSGAGFPGLAIKLFCPNLKVTLLEPNRKKCTFLNEAIRKLDLTESEALPIGFEASKIAPGELTYVASRALGKTSDLLFWSKGKLTPDGCVVLWLGAEDATRTMQISGWRWTEASIPGALKRKILTGIKLT
ncbi:MAG TPA: 16S rRNA (guanine(527)-N(7))-methyltransferase RsmG [Candidatus Acidoferrales bacterium]|nr:16S rRNA (guanine(527)-N(7))-methyltransferase RsmG [Candidatus Acidoferrales bacterium]